MYDEEEQPGAPTPRVHKWGQPVKQTDKDVKGYNKDILTVMTCYFYTHTHTHTPAGTRPGYN